MILLLPLAEALTITLYNVCSLSFSATGHLLFMWINVF